MTACVVLASRNQGKIQELGILLRPCNVEVKGLDAFSGVGEIAETGTTFAENALLKAATVSQALGMVAVGDDSGLMVDALGGEPGVLSARYSQEPGSPATDARNIQKVLANLSALPDAGRTCRFVCAMAAAAPDGRHIIAEATWEGLLTRQPAGSNGFGYDPVFFDPELGMTAAQMRPDQKNARSHRAKACQKLLLLWPDFWREICGTACIQKDERGRSA